MQVWQKTRANEREFGSLRWNFDRDFDAKDLQSTIESSSIHKALRETKQRVVRRSNFTEPRKLETILWTKSLPHLLSRYWINLIEDRHWSFSAYLKRNRSTTSLSSRSNQDTIRLVCFHLSLSIDFATRSSRLSLANHRPFSLLLSAIRWRVINKRLWRRLKSRCMMFASLTGEQKSSHYNSAIGFDRGKFTDKHLHCSTHCGVRVKTNQWTLRLRSCRSAHLA